MKTRSVLRKIQLIIYAHKSFRSRDRLLRSENLSFVFKERSETRMTIIYSKLTSCSNECHWPPFRNEISFFFCILNGERKSLLTRENKLNSSNFGNRDEKSSQMEEETPLKRIIIDNTDKLEAYKRFAAVGHGLTEEALLVNQLIAQVNEKLVTIKRLKLVLERKQKAIGDYGMIVYGLPPPVVYYSPINIDPFIDLDVEFVYDQSEHVLKGSNQIAPQCSEVPSKLKENDDLILLSKVASVLPIKAIARNLEFHLAEAKPSKDVTSTVSDKQNAHNSDQRSCPQCQETTHVDSNSELCKYNPFYLPTSDQSCRSCGLKDHLRISSILCPNNVINKVKTTERQCLSCKGLDHISFRSDLCIKNPNGPLFDGDIVCKHCFLPGHKQERSLNCLKNPRNPHNTLSPNKATRICDQILKKFKISDTTSEETNSSQTSNNTTNENNDSGTGSTILGQSLKRPKPAMSLIQRLNKTRLNRLRNRSRTNGCPKMTDSQKKAIRESLTPKCEILETQNWNKSIFFFFYKLDQGSDNPTESGLSFFHAYAPLGSGVHAWQMRKCWEH